MRNKVDWREIDDLKNRYKVYINKSEEWAEIRQLVFERDGYRCRCCGRTKDESHLSAHHSTYEHLYEEKEHLDDLITLCSNCHLSIHRCRSNWVRFRTDTKYPSIEKTVNVTDGVSEESEGVHHKKEKCVKTPKKGNVRKSRK